MKNTEVLKHIGYSPFNREVDRDRSNESYKNRQRKFIYKISSERVLEKFLPIWNGDLPKWELKDQADQFFYHQNLRI
ncbi:MAG: hypothetical protein WKF59_07410 [Chitinophagaceae bacterium]